MTEIPNRGQRLVRTQQFACDDPQAHLGHGSALFSGGFELAPAAEPDATTLACGAALLESGSVSRAGGGALAAIRVLSAVRSSSRAPSVILVNMAIPSEL